MQNNTGNSQNKLIKDKERLAKILRENLARRKNKLQDNSKSD